MSAPGGLGARAWVGERTGAALRERVFDPRYRGLGSIEAWLASAAMMSFVVLALSGALLALHYQPSMEQAYGSLRGLDAAVPFGRLLRAIHAQGAVLFVGILVAVLFVRLLGRTYCQGGELVWLAGLVVCGLGLGIWLTGSVLPWSLEAQAHARVSAGLLGEIPWLGAWLRRAWLGGTDLGPATLARAYALHVCVLPLALVLVGAAQAVFRWASAARTGLGSASGLATGGAERRPGKTALLGTALLLLLLGLALLLPPTATGTAGASNEPTPVGAGPSWCFAWLDALVRLTPAKLLGLSGPGSVVVALGLLVLLAALLPWLDRRGSRSIIVVGCGALAALLGLSAYGLLV